MTRARGAGATRICWGVVFLAIATVACGAGVVGENLVRNGDAEEGAVGQAPPFWSAVGDDGEEKTTGFPFETVAGGRKSAKAIMVGKPAGCECVDIRQSVPLELAEPAQYRFSVWVRGDKAMPASVDLFIQPVIDQGSGVKLGYAREMSLDVTPEWTELSVDFYTPAAVFDADGKPQRIEVRLRVQLSKAEGPLYIDDVSFESVSVSPEVKAQIESLRKALDAAGAVKAPFSVKGGIIARPDGTLLAFTRDYGVRRSTDGGHAWSGGEKLAVSDPYHNLSGAIQMRNGDIGIWSESWRKPMYFWKSTDGGKTWSERIPMGPMGAPYHGNAMIELQAKDTKTKPLGWYMSVQQVDGEQDKGPSRSTFETVSGGATGARAAALTLAEGDKYMYGATPLTLDRKIAAGDKYRFSVQAKSDKDARFCLYVEAWNHKEKRGSKTREYFNATPEWKTYEVTLVTSEDAAGLDDFRVTIQLYTPGAQLLFDDVKVERVAPEPKALNVANASFERGATGRLVIPVRDAKNFHAGIYEPAGAFGTINGKRVKVEGHGHDPEFCGCFTYYSDDGGATWQRSEADVWVWKDDGVGGMWLADEPNVAQLKDGRLIMLLRTTLGRLYQSFSDDDGRRWSIPEPTELPTGISPCSLERVPENEYTLKTDRAGDLLVVWNNVSRDEVRKGFRRARLCSAVSKDDGKTWEHVRTLAAIGLPPLDRMAQLSPPGMTRADKELGELPMPFGTAAYPDITLYGDRALVRYYVIMRKPSLRVGGRLHVLPLGWFYGED